MKDWHDDETLPDSTIFSRTEYIVRTETHLSKVSCLQMVILLELLLVIARLQSVCQRSKTDPNSKERIRFPCEKYSVERTGSERRKNNSKQNEIMIKPQIRMSQLVQHLSSLIMVIVYLNVLKLLMLINLIGFDLSYFSFSTYLFTSKWQ